MLQDLWKQNQPRVERDTMNEVLKNYKVDCQGLSGTSTSWMMRLLWVPDMSEDLPSGVAYDSWHEFNLLLATFALCGASVRSSEQGQREAYSRAWCGREGVRAGNWEKGLASQGSAGLYAGVKFHWLLPCSGNK